MRSARPASGAQHPADQHRKTARLEDLLPAGPEGDVTVYGRGQVAAEIRPAIEGSRVTHASVELDERPVLGVPDVPDDEPPVAVVRADQLPDLTLAPREPVRPLDLSEVAPLQR